MTWWWGPSCLYLLLLFLWLASPYVVAAMVTEGSSPSSTAIPHLHLQCRHFQVSVHTIRPNCLQSPSWCFQVHYLHTSMVQWSSSRIPKPLHSSFCHTAWYIFHSDGVQLLLQSYCALPHIRFSSGSLGTYLVSMLFTVQTHFAALCTSICLLLEHYRRAINVALLFFRPSIFLHRCFEGLSLCHLPLISTIWYYVYPSLSSSQLFSQSRFRHNSLCW